MLVCFSVSLSDFIKVYQTKVARHPQLSGRSPVWTTNPDLEGPGTSATHFQGDFVKQKL